MLIQQENPLEAICDLKDALKTIHYLGLPVLRGYTPQTLLQRLLPQKAEGHYGLNLVNFAN